MALLPFGPMEMANTAKPRYFIFSVTLLLCKKKKAWAIFEVNFNQLAQVLIVVVFSWLFITQDKVALAIVFCCLLPYMT